jgi:hypothetical protein
VTGKDGKAYPSRPKTTFNKNSRETQKTLDKTMIRGYYYLCK